MRILGIINSTGNRLKDNELKHRLKEFFMAVRSYTNTQSKPAIEQAAELLTLPWDIHAMGALVRQADGIVFVGYVEVASTLPNFIDELGMFDVFEKFGLFGKWVGFILISGKDSEMLRNPVYSGTLLQRANRTGMIPLPRSVAIVRGMYPKYHKVLGRDMANVLSHQHEWQWENLDPALV